MALSYHIHCHCSAGCGLLPLYAQSKEGMHRCTCGKYFARKLALSQFSISVHRHDM